MLPPLSSAPPPSPPASASNSTDLTTKPRIEQLVINHVRFAYAFKQNDAAKILPFLDKDVWLTTMDGARLDGLSAVLAHLVGPRMTKLSSNLRVKGSPSRSGLSQSKLLYEHGLLFRQPLYTEVIEWTPDHAVASIAHVAVAAESKNQSSSKAPPHLEILKSPPVPSTSTASTITNTSRGSFLDVPQDEDEPEHQHLADDLTLDRAIPTTLPRTKSSGCSEKIEKLTNRLSRASSSDSNSHVSTSSSDVVSITNQDVTLKIVQISCADLEPIRSRKHVNSFVTIRKSPHGSSHWKSSVARHEKNPVWTHVPLELRALHDDDILEISLWDFTLFKSTKVATAALVLADLFAQDEVDEFSTTVQLERMELTDTQPPIQLTMKLSHKHPLRWSQSLARERGSQVGDLDAQSLSNYTAVSSQELLSKSSSSARVLERVQWFIQDSVFADSYSRGTNMLLRAAFGLVLVWLISYLDFDKVKAS